MKNILSFLKPYTLTICIAYALTFIELTTDLLLPFFLGKVINEGIMNESMESIVMWSGIMLMLTIISFAAGILNSYFSSHVSVASAFNIREKLFEHIQQFTFEQLAKYPSSMLVTRFTNDVRQIQHTIFMGLRIMVRAPLMVIGSVMMALIVNVKISLIFLITVPLLIAFLYWVLMKGSEMFNKVQSCIDHVNQVIQENIAGMRVIKAFVRSNYENERFSTANKTLAKETKTAFRFVESSMPALLFVMNLSILFILWSGNLQITGGNTTIGDVVAIVNYALRTVMAISMFTFIALAFSRMKASSERVNSVLSEEISCNTHRPTNQSITHGKIEFVDVSFSYPREKVLVLQQVSFTAFPREKLAIIGATGSGKTSLVQLIPRLYEPQSGEIYIDDQPLTSFDMKHLRNNIGYVPQRPLLFTGSIRENITFGKENATEEEMIQAAKDAQIHETILSFPQKYDTIVGQKGVNLSGGQKQRISIARAFIRKPKILMFDDSTSALDIATESSLLDALETYQCTTIIITQKITTAKRAERILLINEGKIVGTGSHVELLHTSKLYQSIVASQQEEGVPHVQ